MKKKKEKKAFLAKDAKHESAEVRAHKQPEETQRAETNENQYGGLPARDLKKNLGCG